MATAVEKLASNMNFSSFGKATELRNIENIIQKVKTKEHTSQIL